jgi:hypothetical protein
MVGVSFVIVSIKVDTSRFPDRDKISRSSRISLIRVCL